MIERPQDYGPQVLDAAAERARDTSHFLSQAMRWRGPALAAHLTAVAGVDA